MNKYNLVEDSLEYLPRLSYFDPLEAGNTFIELLNIFSFNYQYYYN